MKNIFKKSSNFYIEFSAQSGLRRKKPGTLLMHRRPTVYYVFNLLSANLNQSCGSGSIGSVFFCNLPDPDPGPLVGGTDPDPPINKQKYKEKTSL